MHVNVINSDSLGSIDWLIYPEQNQANQRFFYDQVNKFTDSLTNIGRGFMETSREIYNVINDSNAVRMAKAAIRAAKGIFHPNTIYEIGNLDDLRSAQAVMQRYVMAQPTIRNLYHEQRCDGYSDTYIDMEPGKVKEQHYDYRRVMDGVVFETTNSEGETESWSRQYFEELREGDRELDHTEKCMILKTWDIVELFVGKNQDPTNIFGGELG